MCSNVNGRIENEAATHSDLNQYCLKEIYTIPGDYHFLHHLNNGGVPSGLRSVNIQYPIPFTHWLYDMAFYEFTEWYTDQNKFFATDLQQQYLEF